METENVIEMYSVPTEAGVIQQFPITIWGHSRMGRCHWNILMALNEGEKFYICMHVYIYNYIPMYVCLFIYL